MVNDFLNNTNKSIKLAQHLGIDRILRVDKGASIRIVKQLN